MKVYLDENYNILKTDGNNNFTKGNNNYDQITVLIKTALIELDNVLPSFHFELPNGRKYGPFVHNNNAFFENEYTGFKYTLGNELLSEQGKLFLTISINFFNESEKIYKNKNINIQGNIIDAVTFNNNIIILGNEEEILKSLQEKIDALNSRLTDFEYYTIIEANATVDNGTGVPHVDVQLSGNPKKRILDFAFSNLKGEQGKQGIQGDPGKDGYGVNGFEIDENGDLQLFSKNVNTPDYQIKNGYLIVKLD